MFLVNSSFVGGFGATRKMLSLVRWLQAAGIDHKVVTDGNSLEKLSSLGLAPDIVIPVPRDASPSAIYSSVNRKLKRYKYDGMISFGWRTYVPANAVERGKPAIIIDGGWPEVLEDQPGPFWKDVYVNLKAYFLTNFFHDSALDELLPNRELINYDWIAQPFYEDEIDWHLSVGEERRQLRPTLPYHKAGHKYVFLNMSPECVNPRQGKFSGGWLTPEQLDECRGYVTRLLVELDEVSCNSQITLVLHEKIAYQMRPVIEECLNLRVVTHGTLSPEMHHLWRSGAHVVLLRAARHVSSAQAALSALPVLRIICPQRGDYMGEKSTCRIAQRLGITDSIDHERQPIGQKIYDYLQGDRRLELAREAQMLALDFHRNRSFEYMMNSFN